MSNRNPLVEGDQQPGRGPESDWPAHGLEAAASCPLCHRDERRLLYRDLTDLVFRCAPGKWSLYSCEHCQCAYLDPRPTQETIHLAYREYYTHESAARSSADILGPYRRLRRVLANGYRKGRFGGDFAPASPAGSLVVPLLPGVRRSLVQELRYLPRLTGAGRLLDVGCGNGYFLELARSAGWGVVGIDLDREAIEQVRKKGIDARLGGIEQFEGRAELFDAITMSHVIEHVHDPVELVRACYRLLKPGGFLYIDTPNIGAAGFGEFGESWRGLEVPRHLVMFTWDNLESLLRSSGFVDIVRRVRRDVYAPMSAESRKLTFPQARDSATHGTLRHRLHNLVNRLRVLADYRASEFVTVTASKPRATDDSADEDVR